MPNRVEFDCAADKYHASDGYGSTDCKLVLTSVNNWLENRDIHPTEAMQLGTAFHLAVLEPNRFAREVVTRPKFDRRLTKGEAAKQRGKQAAERWDEENAGKLIVTDDQAARVARMADSFRKNPGIQRLWSWEGYNEVSCWARLAGVTAKCRIDRFIPAINTAIDVKTTSEEITPRGFSRTVRKFQYHLQAALYTDVASACEIPVDTFVFVVVQSVPPFDSAMYRLCWKTVADGRRLYNTSLDTFRAMENGTLKWNGITGGDKIQDLEVL